MDRIICMYPYIVHMPSFLYLPQNHAKISALDLYPSFDNTGPIQNQRLRFDHHVTSETHV